MLNYSEHTKNNMRAGFRCVFNSHSQSIAHIVGGFHISSSSPDIFVWLRNKDFPHIVWNNSFGLGDAMVRHDDIRFSSIFFCFVPFRAFKLFHHTKWWKLHHSITACGKMENTDERSNFRFTLLCRKSRYTGINENGALKQYNAEWCILKLKHSLVVKRLTK